MNMEYNREEVENSKRIFKSATPKYTLDWYVKWIASVFVLSAMSIRGIDGLQQTDLILSIIVITLRLIVSLLWKDRSLIVLNTVAVAIYLNGIVQYLWG